MDLFMGYDGRYLNRLRDMLLITGVDSCHEHPRKWAWCQTGNTLRLRESHIAGFDLIDRRGQPNKIIVGVIE